MAVAPYLLYEDVAGMLDWLGRAFGFTETVRMDGGQPYVSHAEMDVPGGSIMMGDPGDDYRNPKHLGAHTFLVHVYVDDVDAHHERARAAGATILEEPADQFYGDRRYAAEDPEGHQWMFAQHVRDVSPEEMRAAMGGST